MATSAAVRLMMNSHGLLLLFVGRRLINETTEAVVDLEVGDRKPGDERGCPDDDLKALLVEGGCKFVHKDAVCVRVRPIIK